MKQFEKLSEENEDEGIEEVVTTPESMSETNNSNTNIITKTKRKQASFLLQLIIKTYILVLNHLVRILHLFNHPANLLHLLNHLTRILRHYERYRKNLLPKKVLRVKFW